MSVVPPGTSLFAIRCFRSGPGRFLAHRGFSNIKQVLHMYVPVFWGLLSSVVYWYENSEGCEQQGSS